MKNIIVKLLCLTLVLAMLLALAGCKKGEEVNTSQPTSSVESTVTSSDTTSETDENLEEDTDTEAEENEKYPERVIADIDINKIKDKDWQVMESFSDYDKTFKGYSKLNETVVKDLTDNNNNFYYALSIEPSVILRMLFGDFKYSYVESAELHPTNLKYKDFENKILQYMSKNRFKKEVLSRNFFAEKDGYLYAFLDGGGGDCGYEALEATLEKEKDGKYTYLVKTALHYTACDFFTYDRVTIVKENGLFVVDTIEDVSVEEVSVKNYTELNETNAKYIIENGLNLENEMKLGCFDMCDVLGFDFYEVDELQFIPELTYDDDGVYSGQIHFYKTNIKETSFKQKLISYVSEKFYSSTKSDYIRAKNGYIYINDRWDLKDFIWVKEATLQTEKGGKNVYLAKCHSTNYEIGDFYVKATIIKQNGNYVLDSCERVK